MSTGLGEVITLMPGSGQIRPDWSPIAQPPDKHGVMAHTPDPNSYHSQGSRTMIPRHSGDFGGSRGFSTKPGVVNIDPSNPTTGAGGITVDLETVSKADYLAAAQQGGGNPLLAWSIAASRQKKKEAAAQQHQAPSQVMPRTVDPMAAMNPATGYVTPHTDHSGAVIPMPQGASHPYAQANVMPVQGVGGSVMAPTGTTTVNPHVKKRDDQMAQPQMEPAPWEGGAPAQPVAAPQSPVLAPEHPSTQIPAQPAQAAQAPQHPQQASQPQYIHGQVYDFSGVYYVFNANTNSFDPYQQPTVPTPTPMAPQTPTPQPVQQHVQPQQMVPQPAQPHVGESTDSLVADTLKVILQELKGLKQGSAPATSWEHEKQGIVEGSRGGLSMEPQEELQPDTPYAALEMPFLGAEPWAPRVQVIFQGPHGMYRTRYHHVARRGICLSLVYDSRYDGDQFIPASTQEGETIRVQVPHLKVDSEAMIFDYHNTIGCLDIINIILVDNDRMGGPPVMTDEVEDQIHDLAGRGAM